MNQKSAVIVLPALVFGAVLTAGLFDRTVRAQEPTRTVEDNVYSEAQATRGAASYDTACSGCHRPDLGGANGPALRGERFARIFAGKDLKTLYTKAATTMPRRRVWAMPCTSTSSRTF
jgi:mono/diheme cytochrome c family protein